MENYFMKKQQPDYSLEEIDKIMQDRSLEEITQKVRDFIMDELTSIKAKIEHLIIMLDKIFFTC
jgi:DNA-binding transcriptional MerR regulator